jgi:hypothetical protein
LACSSFFYRFSCTCMLIFTWGPCMLCFDRAWCCFYVNISSFYIEHWKLLHICVCILISCYNCWCAMQIHAIVRECLFLL